MIVNPILYQQGTKLPELTNPGSAADLLAGKQLVDQYGNPLTGTMPEVEQAVPGISIDANGLITASAVQEAGHVAAGTRSATKQLTKRDASSLSASGAAVTVPAGYYPSQVSKSVATAAHPKPTISRSGGTITAQHVQSAGYTSGGTTTETLSIPTQSGKTVTPGTSRQTAVASGRLTTGAVYVAGDANLVAANIKSGVSIFGVAGSYQGQAVKIQELSNVAVTLVDNKTLKFNLSGLTSVPDTLLRVRLVFDYIITTDGTKYAYPILEFSTKVIEQHESVGTIFGYLAVPSTYYINYQTIWGISTNPVVFVQSNNPNYAVSFNVPAGSSIGSVSFCSVMYI